MGKRIFSLIFILIACNVTSFAQKNIKHVVLIGVDGMSGDLLPQVVKPCNSGPAPMFIEAQFAALELGNTDRASRLQEPLAIMDCITGSWAFLNA